MDAERIAERILALYTDEQLFDAGELATELMKNWREDYTDGPSEYLLEHNGELLESSVERILGHMGQWEFVEVSMAFLHSTDLTDTNHIENVRAMIVKDWHESVEFDYCDQQFIAEVELEILTQMKARLKKYWVAGGIQ